MDVRESYDSAAAQYAEHLAEELTHKPLDRHILDRFAEDVRDSGPVADLGCGPGQVARYLHERGVSVFGIDLSPEMVRIAKRLHPTIAFHVGDMRALAIADAELSGVVAFYSIVHFDAATLRGVLAELRRVVARGGSALLSFHIGDHVAHVDDLFGATVSLDFHFYQPSQVASALRDAGFAIVEQLVRPPYEGVEYPSHRCYLIATAV